MAVGVAIGASTGKEYPGKLTKKVIWTCIVAAMGGLIFGYDIGISGGVTSMAPFLKSFFPDVYRKERGEVSSNQYCQFNNYKLTMFTSSLYLAALVASFFASAATRSWGRKASMLIGGFSFCVGAIINAAAINVAMLIVGRILLGVGIGFANQSTPLYLSEMAPYKHRGFLNMMFQLSITIGILAANLVNYFTAKIKGGWGWRVSLGGAVVPALIFILGSFTLPDTPNSLLERGKVEEARERLRSIRGADVDIDDEFSDLVSACEQSKKVKHPWANLLRRKYRPQFTFAVMIPFFQQLTGMNVFMFYAPVLFKTMGFGDKASLFSAVITGSVNSAATLVSIATVDKFGRKFLFFIGGAQMFICQMIMTYFIKKKFGWGGHPGVLEKSYADGVVAVICVYIAGFAWSWGPLGWLVPSEIFPLEIRSAAQSINVSVNMIFTFFIAQIFLLLMCNLRWCMFLFFGAFVFVMTIFIWRYLPETKGIPIEEMDSIWREHRVWKKIVPPSDTKENIEITVKDKGDC